MPINCYTGLMGSGKSYEVVSFVIIMAILAGRNVVTNVDGIDGDAIREYCAKKHKVDLAGLGTVRHCTNDDVKKEDFLPFGTNDPTFVQPGDLVCIDEAWRFWGTKEKIHANHAIFFREHRHYVNPVTQVSCDLVLMVQDISDLNRLLKVVVELTFRTTKLKSVGFSNKYRIEMWEGYKLTRGARISMNLKKYRPEIFPLYSSYQGGKGKEMQVDSRQNIFANAALWRQIGLMVAGFIISGGCLYYIFYVALVPKDKKQTETASVSTNQKKIDSNGPASASEGFSSKWRLVGYTTNKNGLRLAVIADDAGRLRLESPSVFSGTGFTSIGTVDGQRVTVYSGSLVPEVKK